MTKINFIFASNKVKKNNISFFSWDFPSCPWNSTEKGGLTFGGATLY